MLSASKKKYSLKQRLLLSLMAAVTPAMIMLNGVFGLWVTNREELEFAFVDILPGVLLFCLALVAVLFGILLPFRGRGFEIALSVSAWLSLMAFLQGTYLNIGVNSLAADGVGMKVHPAWEIGNGILWVAALVGILCAVILVKRPAVKEWIWMGVQFVFVLVLGVQIITAGVNLLTTPDPFAPKDADQSRYIITEKNMLEVSSKDNILIFVLDSYDADYVDAVVEQEPDFFAPLDGFTYYSDNLSWYTRTFPAAASMMTGIKNDFSTNAAGYFEKAYGESTFLKDLKNNNYKINLYIDDYYAYRDAGVLSGVADNVSEVKDGYTVEDKGMLTMRMVGMVAYSYMPIPVKRVFDLSTESFKGFVRYNGTDAPMYVSDDVALFDRLEKDGLTVQDEQNTYMFIHMVGCHTPYRMDENGNATAMGTAESTTKGCMRLIYEYMEEMKRLGVYEDATIVITGDHPGRFKDYENVPHPTLTALFFKPKGSAHTPLAYNHTPVAQDMLLPSLVASAGLEMSTPYSGTYWDTPMTLRNYYFLKNTGVTDYRVVEYEIKGSGREFANWKIIRETDIGFLYE